MSAGNHKWSRGKARGNAHSASVGSAGAAIDSRERARARLMSLCAILENLPRFMEHVKNVSTKDEKRSHWVVKAPAGTQVEWTRRSLMICQAS